MRRAIAFFLTLCLLAGTLGGCRAREMKKIEEKARTRTILAMDTVLTITAYGRKGEEGLTNAAAALYEMDALLARGRESSAVYAFNHRGELSADESFTRVMEIAESARTATGGAYDPYLGAVLDLWGFGSGAGEHRVPTDEELAAAPPLLDLGGIAKGWAGQQVQAILTEAGVKAAVIDLGGDVSLLGAKPDGSPWRVAIKDPQDTNFRVGVLEVTGKCSIMTSGSYERWFEEGGVRYHHIIDPETGYPVQNEVLSATVICEYGAWADALATAVCVIGSDAALALRETLKDEIPFDLVLVLSDGRVIYTTESFRPGFNSYTFERV